MAATQDVDVGLSGGAFEHPGEQILLFCQGAVTDRAGPGALALKTEQAALNVHHPVPSVEGGEGHRLNQMEVLQPGGTDRAALGSPGPAFPDFSRVRAGFYQNSPRSFPEKQGVSKPEQDKSDKHKGKNGQHGSRYHSRKV
jgi:hypothetical protein